MNNKPYTWLMISLLFLLAACQTQPKVINHNPPALSVSFDKFLEAACPLDGNGSVNCGSDHPLRKCFLSSRIRLANDQIQPNLPD